MSNDDGGPAPGCVVQSSHDGVLSDGVQAGGGLVKYQNRTVLKDSSGDSYSLLLTT